MRPEEKDLLLKDLCARLPYGVIMTNIELRETHYPLTCEDLHDAMFDDGWDDVPYLRPMSSMTEEEIIEFNNIPSTKNYTIIENDLPWDVAHYKQMDWLNKKMFDFRGLIPKDRAISTETFNPYKD